MLSYACAHCTVPAGYGVGWYVFVVNNDSAVDGVAVQSSLPSPTSIDYRRPVIFGVDSPGSGFDAPASGGFLVVVTGSGMNANVSYTPD